MSILISLFVILGLLWLLGWWFARGEDLTAYDHPVEPSASERFGRAGGPSPEHREAEGPHDEEVHHRRSFLVLDQLDVAGGECRGCRSREHADDGESGERGAQVSEHG